MQNKTITVVVSRAEQNLPLIHFLARRLSLSNKKVKQLLDDRNVFVNNQRIWMARHPLEAGDRIEVHGAMAEKQNAQTIAVLFQDDDYMVVNKPAGLLSNGPESLEAALSETMNNRHLVAVHRLDRETSGCLLLAKNEAARDVMMPLFQEREIKKLYRALVFGSFPKHVHTVKIPIEGHEAITHIQTIKSNSKGSELELTIETGRTHQIRKHLSVLKHPVIGDKVYQTHAISLPQLRNVQRHMLHAYVLEFTHPQTKQTIRAKAPLPSDFMACRRVLGLG